MRKVVVERMASLRVNQQPFIEDPCMQGIMGKTGITTSYAAWLAGVTSSFPSSNFSQAWMCLFILRRML